MMAVVAALMLCFGGCSHERPKEEGTPTGVDQPLDALDDTVYLGEYLDADTKEAGLEIAKGKDGSYIIQIGIYRLTSLSDGVGELTAEGMKFTATDAADNPISGVITVEGEAATVTFTDSTWEYLENGASFSYIKSSNVPNLWEQ